jgi:hypothetical protein
MLIRTKDELIILLIGKIEVNSRDKSHSICLYLEHLQQFGNFHMANLMICQVAEVFAK